MDDIIQAIRKKLSELSDEKYRDMQKGLIPNIPPESIIGVRIPVLRGVAKELRSAPDDAEVFLRSLPHKYYDENVLHAVIVSGEKQPEKCIERLEAFLPYIDNWAVCDTIRPKCFKRSPESLYENILCGKLKEWLRSDRPYTVRCAMGLMMSFYLDGGFRPEQPEMIVKALEASPCAEDYYVRMMAAWYFATALAKQYGSVIGYIEENRLDIWTHNKTIQKAAESFRVTPEHKEYLRSLKRR